MKTDRCVDCRIACVSLLILAAVGGMAMAADTYPVRPVRLIVAFAPGGSNDLTARLIAGPLGAALGQQVVVENRAGAGGLIGTEYVARSAPDGHTLMVGTSSTHSVLQSLYPKSSYNVLRDFQPVARLSDSPIVLAVHPSLPARSVKEFLGLVRANPGQITNAVAGTGSTPHLAAVLFEHVAKVKLVHVQYKGGGPASIAAVAGEVPVLFGTAVAVSPHMKTGRLRGIAVTGSERSTLVPELPTIAEGGLPTYEMVNWMGMFAPSSTPGTVVQKLSLQLIRIMRLPEIVERLKAQGAEPLVLGTDQFTAFVAAEVERWARIIAVTGMKGE